jgi:hypothetical protein
VKTRTLKIAGCGTQIRSGPLSLRHLASGSRFTIAGGHAVGTTLRVFYLIQTERFCVGYNWVPARVYPRIKKRLSPDWGDL